jgi:hypothetical protein
MSRCFVIQPFDAGRFDKRFHDAFKPAIIAAGLEPYRVDQDPNVEIPIQSIEDGIQQSAICLADITTDNPNVWYELGYAFASNTPVVMVCCDERTGMHYPFDIQHRTIIKYSSESSSDFDSLKEKIRDRLKALLRKIENLQKIAAASSLNDIQGLSQPELAVLTSLAGDAVLPGSTSSLYSLQRDVEGAGFTSVGFGLGLRRLLAKQLVASVEETDHNGESYPAAKLTDTGWAWVEQHENMFVLKNGSAAAVGFEDEEIPF